MVPISCIIASCRYLDNLFFFTPRQIFLVAICRVCFHPSTSLVACRPSQFLWLFHLEVIASSSVCTLYLSLLSHCSPRVPISSSTPVRLSPCRHVHSFSSFPWESQLPSVPFAFLSFYIFSSISLNGSLSVVVLQYYWFLFFYYYFFNSNNWSDPLCSKTNVAKCLHVKLCFQFEVQSWPLVLVRWKRTLFQ